MLCRRLGNVKFNTVGGVYLLCCGGIKIGNLVFAGRMFVENPQRLAGDSVTLGRDAVAVAEDKNCSCRRLSCRHGCAGVRCGRAILRIAPAFFTPQIVNFIREPLDFSGQFHAVAVVCIYDNRLLLRRRSVAIIIAIIVTGKIGIER